MIAQYAGAFLGLLAFTVATLAGLIARNSVVVTLTRSVLALFLFCILGFVLGYLAQLVVNERQKQRETELRKRFRAADSGQATSGIASASSGQAFGGN